MARIKDLQILTAEGGHACAQIWLHLTKFRQTHCQNGMHLTGVGRSNSTPAPADAGLPVPAETISRGQSVGPETQPVTGHSSGDNTPSISPSGASQQEAMLSPAKMDALRERMNKISAAAAVSEQVPSPVLPAATVRTDISHMTGTMEALQQRMSLLRRKQELS